MSLQGSLKEMSLANLIQVNCQEMRSARLTLSRRGQKGELYFSDGQVVHASHGNHVGEQAVFRLLLWEEGTFALETDVHSPQVTIEKPWNELLLDGMKEMAAWQANEHEGETPAFPGLLDQLRAIEGVTGVIIAACDGVVLAGDPSDGDGDQKAAVTVFVGSAASQIGQALGLEAFGQAIVTLKNKRVLILPQPDRYIGLWLKDNASPAIVAGAAARVLQ